MRGTMHMDPIMDQTTTFGQKKPIKTLSIDALKILILIKIARCFLGLQFFKKMHISYLVQFTTIKVTFFFKELCKNVIFKKSLSQFGVFRIW